MASRPLMPPNPVIVDGDMSDDIVSDVTICTNMSVCSYSYSWVGTSPVGTVTVEVSNDYSVNADGTENDSGTWEAYPGVAGAVSGNTGHGRIDILAMVGYAIRTKYTRASGVGTLQSTIVGKVT